MHADQWNLRVLQRVAVQINQSLARGSIIASDARPDKGMHSRRTLVILRNPDSVSEQEQARPSGTIDEHTSIASSVARQWHQDNRAIVKKIKAGTKTLVSGTCAVKALNGITTHEPPHKSITRVEQSVLR